MCSKIKFIISGKLWRYNFFLVPSAIWSTKRQYISTWHISLQIVPTCWHPTAVMPLGVSHIGIFVLILGGFSLNGYILFSLWHVFVICSNSENTTNNQYEILCIVFFDCLAVHRCIWGPIDCGKSSPEGQWVRLSWDWPIRRNSYHHFRNVYFLLYAFKWNVICKKLKWIWVFLNNTYSLW